MTSTSTEVLDARALEEAANAIVPLPAATARLIAVANDPDVTVGAVVDIVRYDPGLTAALLRQANSAHSMAARPVTDVRDAVVRLGLTTVVTIAMRGAVASSLSGALDIYDLEGGDMYRHAVLAAVAAEELRVRRPRLVPAITPTVALLHDVGKLVIAHAIGNRAMELVTTLAASDGHAVHEEELAVFGLHHGHAGAYVIRRWKLPTSFLEGIVNHHGAEGAPTFSAMAVQLADELAHASATHLEHAAATQALQAQRGELARLYPDMSPDDVDALAPAPAAAPGAPEISSALVGLGARFEFDAGTVPELIDATASRYESIRSSLEG